MNFQIETSANASFPAVTQTAQKKAGKTDQNNFRKQKIPIKNDFEKQGTRIKTGFEAPTSL